MKKATTIIPTTGESSVIDSIKSVLNQNYDESHAYVVIDGDKNTKKFYDEFFRADLQNHSKFKTHLNIVILPENVGANGFYGHRVYAAFTHLINSDYVLYLDQDCSFEFNHVKGMVNMIEENNYDWCYSLRRIVDQNKQYICNDDCESLGKWNPVMQYNHVDTNCYCIKTEVATKVCSIWHGGWGTDRAFYSVISNAFKNYNCSGEYTVNYAIGGNEGSVTAEFFKQWNEKVNEMYNGKFPWRKE